MYLVREHNGCLSLSTLKPEKDLEMGIWNTPSTHGNMWMTIEEEDLPLGVNPHWSDKEPVEVELISKKQTPVNLILWSERMQGARAILMRLMENGMLLEAGWKCASIYTKAQTELILDSLDNTNKFLRGDKILYYDHKRNKSGKLISVKAKFDERKTIYTEV